MTERTVIDGKIGVHYVQHVGDDAMVVNAARVSYNNDKIKHVLAQSDVGLIHYLAKHDHMSPFEHNVLTVVVECPIFTRGHIHRHRTFSYNEVSRRYTSDGITFWEPYEWHRQGGKNKQQSGEAFPLPMQRILYERYREALETCHEVYEEFIEMGVAREEARAVLPLSLNTRFYMTGNLRNWVHFIRLRDDPKNAQGVDVVIARLVRDIICSIWPISYDALKGTQMKSDVRVTTGDDWQGLYVGDQLIEEGHRITASDVVGTLSRLGLINGTLVNVEKQLEAEGRCPQSFSDVISDEEWERDDDA